MFSLKRDLLNRCVKCCTCKRFFDNKQTLRKKVLIVEDFLENYIFASLLRQKKHLILPCFRLVSKAVLYSSSVVVYTTPKLEYI
jgi:hypothetical protein